MKNVKDNLFYQKVIDRNKEFILENKSMLEEIKKDNDKKSNPSILAYFIWHLNNIISSYSKGENKEELKHQFSETVQVMEKVWDKRITKVYHGRKQEEYDQYKFNSYLHILQMFSLAVLLDVPDDDFRVLVKLIDQDNIKDFLIEFIISSRIKNRKPIKEESYKRYLLIPKLYEKLVAITNEQDLKQATVATKKYLEKDWIKVYKNYFIDFKLSNVENYDVESGFTGIWAFEVAAVVKIKGLNDESFRGTIFYPDRLV